MREKGRRDIRREDPRNRTMYSHWAGPEAFVPLVSTGSVKRLSLISSKHRRVTVRDVEEIEPAAHRKGCVLFFICASGFLFPVGRKYNAR